MKDLLALRLLQGLFKTFVKEVRAGQTIQNPQGIVLGYRLDIPTHNIQLPKFKRRRLETRKRRQHER